MFNFNSVPRKSSEYWFLMIGSESIEILLLQNVQVLQRRYD